MPTTTVEPILLSGSTDGRRIKVAATSTPGTTLHTATSTSGQIDWVTLYAQNSHTADVLLTVEFGGTTSPDDLIQQTIPAKSGDVLLVAGLPLRAGLLVRAFAAVTNVVTVAGSVERSTTT